MVSANDTQICRQVEELLDSDRRTKDAVIDVSCLAGVVTLVGEVKQTESKAAAEELAGSVGGVHAVDNELRVR
jgi:osmotically-inducible protein OsmY